MTGTGKAVDTGDPMLPVQMPRGYGGSAILWKRTIDHLVRVLQDGGNRIQCVEPGFIRVREMSGKFKFFQGQGIVREFNVVSGKNECFLKCQGNVREF